jgi:hypothetical protein
VVTITFIYLTINVNIDTFSMCVCPLILGTDNWEASSSNKPHKDSLHCADLCASVAVPTQGIVTS